MGGTISVTASSTPRVLPRYPRFEHGAVAVAPAYANDQPLHRPSRLLLLHSSFLHFNFSFNIALEFKSSFNIAGTA